MDITIIIQISVFLGALTTIFIFFQKSFKIFHKLRDWLNEPVQFSIEKIKEDNKQIHDEIKKLSGDILQLKICSPNIPIEERLLAGHEYVEVRNLNGKVKVQYEVLKEEYEKEFKEQQ